ncbi:MAG TPA: glycosyltransferase family 2 protein [Bryobacteraceae bacterium]|nr:glycosyltransferase family 2 protein [Bryobacteraceae bacterium]
MIQARGKAPLMILIPAFNEEGAVGEVIRELHAYHPDLPVLVVDDGSADGTRSVAQKAGADVITVPYHLGLGGCVQAGYRLAFDLGFQYVIRLDGDGQHDPAYVGRILGALQTSGAQMVIGSRYVDGEGEHTSFARGVGIVFFRWFLGLILGKKVHDPTSGFVGVNRQALEVFARSFPLEYPEIEALVVLQRLTFRFEEVPVKMRPRMAGESTITAVRSFYYVLHVLLGVLVNILKYQGSKRRP